MSKEVSILVEYPSPETVIMQYTGLSEVTGMEPPVYACVGTNDGIASYRSMEQYISEIKADGTNAEIEVFDGLSHGFGLGLGTVAKGGLTVLSHSGKKIVSNESRWIKCRQGR